VYTFDHFGKKASFNDEQAAVVQAMSRDFCDMVSKWVFLDIEKEELEKKLEEKETELQELQAIVDASISDLDPDRL